MSLNICNSDYYSNEIRRVELEKVKPFGYFIIHAFEHCYTINMPTYFFIILLFVMNFALKNFDECSRLRMTDGFYEKFSV